MQLFDQVSLKCSKITTTSYSTSFSLGIKLLHKKFHDPIYAIYGFVRFADEIVDTFHEHNKTVLLERFKEETYKAIEDGISLNPILNSFQWAVNKYQIDRLLIDTFLHSMEMDLLQSFHDQASYEEYILGSAEVVGLMCLQVFCEGDKAMYESLKHQAMKLGSAFQKINFLRDLQADFQHLGRTYFPGVEMSRFDDKVKKEIEADIEKDFASGLEGIMNLPIGAKLGVYVAYVYYYNLF
ncbi:MAG: phytoene/squalene synthase family protein, partial [Bacteroidia bacterium]